MTALYQASEYANVFTVERVNNDAVFVRIAGEERDAGPVAFAGVRNFRQSVSGGCAPRRFDQQDLGPEASEQPACMFGQRVCDLGALRVPYKTENDSIGYRCPAEPLRAYSHVKGGRAANTDGRLCLCNGLLATAGLAQFRTKTGYEEPPLVTAGSDFDTVRELMDLVPPGQNLYSAGDVIDSLLGDIAN